MKHVQPTDPEELGAATIEFALLTLFFFICSLVALDFANYFVQRSQLAAAVSAASISAFSNRTAVPFQDLPTYVRNAGRLSDPPQVSLSCNGTVNGCVNNGRTCACPSKTGAYVPASCGSSCPAGNTSASTAGYYLQITASSRYRAVILPRGMLNGTAIVQSVAIRLE